MQSIKTTNTKILKIFTFLTFCLLFFSVIFRIYCSNDIAIKNEEFRILHADKLELEKEISKLRFIDANLSSLVAIEQKVLSMGFEEFNGSLLAIDPSSPIPVAANLPN